MHGFPIMFEVGWVGFLLCLRVGGFPVMFEGRWVRLLLFEGRWVVYYCLKVDLLLFEGRWVGLLLCLRVSGWVYYCLRVVRCISYYVLEWVVDFLLCLKEGW